MWDNGCQVGNIVAVEPTTTQKKDKKMKELKYVLLGIVIFLFAILAAGCEPVEFQNYNIVTGWEETNG